MRLRRIAADATSLPPEILFPDDQFAACVVPAQAGTYTPCPRGQWLWVPAFAGTTSWRLRIHAAGAHETAGHGAGVLALLEDRRSGDERRLVAVDALHEAAAAGRHVVHEFRLVEPQAGKNDQGHVGAQARREPAAVPQAEENGGLRGVGRCP